MAAYAHSKLATMLFTHELARRGIRAYSSDLGVADTDITRDGTGLLHGGAEHVLRRVGQSAPAAARANIEAVTTDLPSGTYFVPRFKAWGKPTNSDQTTPRQESLRPDGGPSTVGTVRRADRLLMDISSHRASLLTPKPRKDHPRHRRLHRGTDPTLRHVHRGAH